MLDGGMTSRGAVHEPRQVVDQRLGHVVDHRQAAAHVAIERAVADGELGLVAGGQQQATRACSSTPSAPRRAHVPGCSLRPRPVAPAARAPAHRGIAGRCRRWGRRDSAMPRLRASALGVAQRVVRGIPGRHRDAGDLCWPQRVGGQRRGERGVDAAGQAEHDRREPALADVVAQAEPKRVPRLLLARRADLGAEAPAAAALRGFRRPWHVDDDEGLLEIVGAAGSRRRSHRTRGSGRRKSARRCRQPDSGTGTARDGAPRAGGSCRAGWPPCPSRRDSTRC